MTTDEKITLLNDAYDKAVKAGIVGSRKEFAELAGISRSGLSSAMNGDPKYLTDSLLAKAMAAVRGDNISVSNSPHSNVATGNGHIVIGSHIGQGGGVMVPIIPTSLYKESDIRVSDYLTTHQVPQSPAVAQFPSISCYYTVDSEAMAPLFQKGDTLALKETRSGATIVNGEVYAINSAELGIILRMTYDKGDYVELRTPEDGGRYEPFRIRKDDIYTIYRVVGLIRTNI